MRRLVGPGAPRHTRGGALRYGDYFSDVNARSHWPRYSLDTPLTFVDRMPGVLSQTQSTAGASSVSFLSISPHVFPRSAGSVMVLASSIILLSCGSFSCDQLELPVWRMFPPLKVGSRYVWASEKSFNQPTFGQIATLAGGELQNFVYMASWVTSRSRTLKPIFSKFSFATSAAFCATPSDVPTISRSSLPSYLPEA